MSSDTKRQEVTREGIRYFMEASVGRDTGYSLAVALFEEFGWPLVALTKKTVIFPKKKKKNKGKTKPCKKRGERRDFLHVGVRIPGGGIWDGRGGITKEEFQKFYLNPNVATVVVDIKKKELVATGRVHEFLVEFFIENAKKFWPEELPWKNPQGT